MFFKVISQLILIFVLSLIFSQKIFASRNITITTSKSSLKGFEEMTVNISSMSGFVDNETIYIKGAFYQDGSSNYFGYTKKDNDWVRNSDSTPSQRQVQINNWDKNIIVKSDFADSGYRGEGDYKFRIGFYYITSGGNISPVSWSSNSVDVAINDPDPTSTPIPTPTPTSPPTSTPESAPTTIPTKKPTLSPTYQILGIATSSGVDASEDGLILNNQEATPTGVTKVAGMHTSILPGLFFGLGGVILIGCGILFIYKYRKNDNENEDSN